MLKTQNLAPLKLAPIKLAIDLMGGDVLPEVIFGAAKSAASFFLSHDIPVQCIIFASEEKAKLFSLELNGLPVSSCFIFHSCSDVIQMDEKPLLAVKNKPCSSLVQGVLSVQKKEADAFISCGNTGALISASALLLKQTKLVNSNNKLRVRPALATFLPTLKKPVCVLDVGANVCVKAQDLISFAYLGAQFYKKKFKQERPRVALLNIGKESTKGTKELQEAYLFLAKEAKAPFLFAGNTEARDVFCGDIDVLVTGGFAGNIFLKTAEATSEFIFEKARHVVENKELRDLQQGLSYESSRGAYVLGVEGQVIKCHGLSSERAIYNALIGAYTQ